ncbi:MAG: DUF488 domain-containing protein [Anaerolineales bacterium]|jgi:uncharacterized protein YeaO (DUF488 family)
MTQIDLKRIYQPYAKSDGMRVLVDRLWPRGMSKEKARLDFWAKEIAPSDELRKWYGHQPNRWLEFQKRYCAELNAQPDVVNDLVERIKGQHVTFLYSSKEEELNNAVALRDYIQQRLK